MSLYLGQQCCRAWPLAWLPGWLASLAVAAAAATSSCNKSHSRIWATEAGRLYGTRLGANLFLIVVNGQNVKVSRLSLVDAALAAFAVYTGAWLLFAGQFAGCI